jgi:hypothetical protein
MARGIGEPPQRSPAYHLAEMEFPASRDEIVETAADNDAPPEVINFFKSLPGVQYGSQEEVMRDFAEAERRMAAGPAAGDRSRRDDLGRGAAEGAGKHP